MTSLSVHLWSLVCEFAEQKTLAAILRAAPRFQLDFNGMILTRVFRFYDVPLYSDHDSRRGEEGTNIVLPFAEIELEANDIPSDAEPWFHQVVGLSVSSHSENVNINNRKFPPNLRFLRMGWIVDRKYLLPGTFPNSLEILSFRLASHVTFDRGWLPPLLTKLIVVVTEAQLPALVASLPHHLRALKLEIGALHDTVFTLPLRSLKFLETLECPENTIAANRDLLPSSLKTLCVYHVVGDQSLLLHTMFPESLRELEIRKAYTSPVRKNTFPKHLRRLRVRVTAFSSVALPNTWCPESLEDLDVDVEGSFASPMFVDFKNFTRLTKLRMVVGHLNILRGGAIVFRAGSLPPSLSSFEFITTGWRVFMESGAIPSNASPVSLRCSRVDFVHTVENIFS